MIDTKHKKLLNEIAHKCKSVDEFKLECTVRGLNIPIDEGQFVKWLFSIACETADSKLPLKRKMPFLFPGPGVWKNRIWKYLETVIDSILTKEKFLNLVKTNILVKAKEIDYSMKDEHFFDRSFSRKSHKERIRYIWKVKNRLKISPVNELFMLAYAKKHGGLQI